MPHHRRRAGELRKRQPHVDGRLQQRVGIGALERLLRLALEHLGVRGCLAHGVGVRLVDLDDGYARALVLLHDELAVTVYDYHIVVGGCHIGIPPPRITPSRRQKPRHGQLLNFDVSHSHS